MRAFIALFFLWVLPLQSEASVDLGITWEGRVIDEIHFDVDGPYNAIELYRLIQMQPSDLYQASLIREAVKRLYQTEQFKSVWVSVKPIGERRLSLEIHWVKNRLLTSIQFSNNRLLSDEEIIQTMGLKPGDWFSEDALSRGIENIKTRYRQMGYFQAEISSKLIFAKGRILGVDARLQIHEGLRTKIRKVTFLGEKVFSDWRLNLKIYSNKGEFYRMDELKEDIVRLKQFYVGENYYQAVIGPTAVVYNEQTNEVDLTISIQPFDRFSIFFEGDNLYSRDKLEALLPIQKEQSSSESVLEESARQLKQFYLSEGYPFVKTRYRVSRSKQENKTDIYFEIESGHRVSVRTIRFSGHHIFSRKNLLKRIRLSPSKFLDRQYYRKATLEKSVASLTNFYREEGFSNVKINGVTHFNEGNQSAEIVFKIDEGLRTRVKTLGIKGNHVLSDDVLIKSTHISQDMPFTETKLRQGRRKLVAAYAKEGYLNVDVSAELHLSLDELDADITYHVSEGPQTRVGKIILEGNKTTQSNVILRELKIKTGAPYNPAAILESQREIYQTGHFSTVRIEPADEEESSNTQSISGKKIKTQGRLAENELKKQDINLTVVEKPRRSLEFGLGYGDRERVRGFFEATHQNIWGTGQSLSARMERSEVEERYFLIYRKPWFFDEHITARAIASYVNDREVSFDLETFSLVFGIDKKFSRHLSGGLFYQIERKQTTNIPVAADVTALDEEELFTIGSLNPSFVYDTRDDPFNPRSGSISSIVFQDAAQILASEIQLVKMTLQNRSFYPLSKKSVFAFSARVGVAERFGETEIIPIAERFFIGGRNTVRGYDEDELGVVGQTFINDSPVGGNAMLILNEELRYALPRSFGLVLFFDHGNVWTRYKKVTFSEIKSTAGLGLRYNTPIGPFRLDWGFKLDREVAESPSVFHFSLGHAF